MDGTPMRGDAPGDDLDPDVRRFIRSVNAAFANHPQFEQASLAQRRAIAEAVRAPWAAGGPQMARRVETIIPTRSGPLRLRVHNPSASSPKPALLYLHGGGWTMFSIDTHDRVMREYAARADAVVIGADYALSPETRFPGALHQVIDAVRWCRANGAEYGVDVARLALGGDSAGGNLSLAAAVSLRDSGEGDALRALLLNYAAVDRNWSAAAERRYGGAAYMLGGDEMKWFWENYAGPAADAQEPLICPFHADLRGLPPVFLTIAECDLLAEQNLALAAKLDDAGVPAKAVVYRGASHSFLEAVSIASLSAQAFDDAAQWLRDALA